MPANIYKAQKSYKKDWIRMVGKTLTELKKEDPTEIGSDQVIEKVILDFSLFEFQLRACFGFNVKKNWKYFSYELYGKTQLTTILFPTKLSNK